MREVVRCISTINASGLNLLLAAPRRGQSPFIENRAPCVYTHTRVSIGKLKPQHKSLQEEDLIWSDYPAHFVTIKQGQPTVGSHHRSHRQCCNNTELHHHLKNIIYTYLICYTHRQVGFT